MSKHDTADNKDATWNHRGPVEFSPIFDWPPKPREAFLALTKRWVSITRNLLFLLFAIGVYNILLPDLEAMQTLSLSWILPAFIRNVVLLTIVAGGLHLLFFTFRVQDKKLKFHPRQEMEKSRKFIFDNQLHDNIFRSLASGATIWTLYEVLYFWGAANGVVPVFGFVENALGFIIWLLVLPIVLSSHFYLIHRLFHWPPLFNRYHRQHHYNIHIGPWSGMAMHPVEHIFYISSVLIHFVIPSHPVIVLVHLYTRSMAPAFSHSGFEKLLIKDKTITESADFHHQLHHKYFECNYGNVDAPWDRWFGSVHDGSDEATASVQRRRKAMYKNRLQKTG